MRRQLALIGALALAGACAVPGAAAVDPAGACAAIADSLNGQEMAVVGMTAADVGPITGETVLYPGTTLSLALCRADGDVVRTRGGQGWDLAAHPAIETTTDRSTHWRVEIASNNETVEIRKLVKNKSVARGVTVRVQTGLAYQSAVTNDTLVFGDRERRNRVKRAESGFLDADAAVSDNATALNETRRALADGGPVEVERIERANETLANLTHARESMRQRRIKTTQHLYNSTVAGTARTGNALAVIEAVDQRDERTSGEAREILRSYREAVEKRTAALEGAVILNVLLGLVGGGLLGLVAGAVPPYRAAREYEDFRATTSDASYDRSVVTYPVTAGVVLALVGLAVVVTTGGLGVVL